MTTAEIHENQPHHRRESARCHRESRGVWTPFIIAMMVLGFIILFGLIAGVSPMELPGKIMSWFGEARDQFDTVRSKAAPRASRSGNAVFDEYQQTQLDRIDEIRTEVRDREQRFSSFKSEEQRSKEKKQFDRFMGRDQEEDL